MRKLTGIIALLLMLFAFPACAGGDAGADNQNPQDNQSEADNITGDIIEDEEEEEVENPGNVTDPDKPIVALTLDDGPNTTVSADILDALEERGVVATYFVIGGNINDQTAEIMRRAYALGCEYANHSWGWESMGRMEAETIIKSTTRTSDKIAEILGEDARPRFFRAPNLNTSAEMLETVKELGYPLMNGITGNDWTNIDAEGIFDLIVPKVEDGSIILLHDGTSNTATAEAIGDIIDALLEKGFQFVTLTEMFEIKGIEPEAGKIYNSVWG
ncbi:MAG: polysaccharide deacetylase family protein [Oscillospiraceae bacterium]|jgi:peptidoglycan/xylan/chitin deacetylase (PgdA/CDA1 family)|nr:polysaccharide deacetylase family protein [Oscillospiraceae bacterium]